MRLQNATCEEAMTLLGRLSFFLSYSVHTFFLLSYLGFTQFVFWLRGINHITSFRTQMTVYDTEADMS